MSQNSKIDPIIRHKTILDPNTQILKKQNKSRYASKSNGFEITEITGEKFEHIWFQQNGTLISDEHYLFGVS